MESIFLACFIGGLLFTIGSVLFGGVFDLDVDTDFPFLSPTTIATAVTVFGGSGLYLSRLYEMSISVIVLIALTLAVAASALLFFLMMYLLKKGNKSAAQSSEDMIGKTAEVSVSISGRSKGEIVYEQGGSRLSSPAVSENGEDIRQGAFVCITGSSSGTFIVKKKGETQ